MFDMNSRYHTIEEANHTLANGQVVRYKRRRFVPQPDSMETLIHVRIEQKDRIDCITADTLGDPLQFWRLCDANYVMHPSELTDEIGRHIRIPIPKI